ncbi:glycosyltransferase family 4 protein [Echinicola shivajiensis]|uniref:glycosyltransferase family 4 protein n=1 Tax=Echinicola shivajiensis TaxID=1035916 RepID=UPI001BFC34D6|nr:glycosyltransferase family 4 protein [Echinicola shivajiensis]
MKILFLTDNFPPEVNAPANRTYEHCKEWVKEGVEVTVITCVPNFPKGKVYEGYKNKLYQTEEIDGIKVIRVWSYITANEGFVKRILDYISYAFMAFWAGLFVKTDLIVATSPQFFTTISGWFLSFFKRKKWVMEVRDLWPESIIAVGAMKKNLFIHFFEWLEVKMYKSADHIVVVTDTFKRKIIEKGIDGNKISVFKNGANLDLFKESEKPAYLLEKHQLENKFIFAYIGTHGMAHGLHFILDSVGELQDSHPNLLFLFMGDGAEKKKLLAKAEQNKLKNVLFLDSVSKKEVVDYLNLMDVALVNLKKSDTFLTVIPSKIFEAAAVRRPILLGLEGETKGIIESYDAGACFIPEDKYTFLEKVIMISNDENKYYDYQVGCERLARDFDRKKLAKGLLRNLREVVA